MVALGRDRRTCTVAFAAAAAALLALNMAWSYFLGQYRTMYDNPVYRWRESMVIALSELQTVPSRGYVGYRSIKNYLALHGLGLGMSDEPGPPASNEDITKLVYDAPRLEQLLREARGTSIDRSLPPVRLAGSDPGQIDFYYWAFRLFGLNLAALWKTYFLILAVAGALFFIQFRRSPFCLLMLLLYLIAHLVMVSYSVLPYIVTVHNTRFFPVLAMLPAMHLLLLIQRREGLSWASAGIAAVQTFILFFAVFCRFTAMWEPAAVVASAALVTPFSFGWRTLRHGGGVVKAGRGLFSAWPAAIVLLGLAGLYGYHAVAFDKTAYATEMETHVLWAPLYSGTVEVSPQLQALRTEGSDLNSDGLVAIAVLRYLREHNIENSPITFLDGGVMRIEPKRNMGVFDGLARKAFFELAKKYPWLVLKSFLMDKPRAQLQLLYDLPQSGLAQATTAAARQRVALVFGGSVWPWLMPALLAIGAGGLAALCDVDRAQRAAFVRALVVVALVAVFSAVTTIVEPSPLILDTVLYFVLLVLFLIAYVPIFLITALR